MTTKEALHRLIDELPDGEAEQLLHALQAPDPILRAIALAPEDDEPETDEQREGMREARAQAARGELLDDADLIL